ncbi:MAG: putative porin [Bacteroidetes bacterium]|nr:putative porin [Bacteroidota bacterium]
MSTKRGLNIIRIALFSLAIAFCAMPEVVSAQINQGSFKDIYDDPLNPKEDEVLDTLPKAKRTRPLRPLSSYYFNDSITSRNMFAWKFDSNNNNIEIVEMDTLLQDFQKDYFFLKENKYGVTYLGNLGAGVQPLSYDDRSSAYHLSFMDPYNDYIFREDNVLFYNGRLPYTNTSYFTSGQRTMSEEDFTLTHQQNISPSTGINLSYRNNRTRGMYSNQKSINKNLSIALSHSGKKYSMHMGYIFNSGNIEENGGVLRDKDIFDTIIDLTRNVEMQLKDAHTKYKGNVFYFTQSLAVPLISYAKMDTAKIRDVLTKLKVENSTVLFFGTSFKYSAYSKVYKDSKEQSNEYYDNWYINPNFTRDSMRERQIDVKFFSQFQPYNRYGVLGLLGGGIGYTNEKYSSFSPSDFITDKEDNVKNNIYVYANAQGQLREYLKWNADIKYMPIGERNQDISFGGNLDLSAFIKNTPITLALNGRFELQEPTYWEKSFYTNHFKWNNNFDKQKITKFNAELRIPYFRMKIGAKQHFLLDKIYYSADCTPKQFDGTVSVTEAYIQKNFVYKGIHLEHNVLFQYSSEEKVVAVPMLSVNLCYFYEFNVVKNALRMSIGAECYYNTEYKGPGYNPAIGQFYNQQEVNIGNYPLTNVFVTAKWKRMRILMKYQHVNYELFGGRNYMVTAHYPHNRGMFKYGIAWSFYD